MKAYLFEPFQLGALNLRNRVVMAPMTRCRASAEHVPTEIMAKYYGQRASAGLIVTEGTSPSPNGLGYARIPGLFDRKHVEAWSKVTEAVHERGGTIFVQLMHTGRVSHPDNMSAGSHILAPSPLALSGEMWTDQNGLQPYPTPSEMSEDDIASTVQEYAKSAKLAIEAGFDGIELHGANGYLIDQFLNTVSNQRTDGWGASIEGRLRFAMEVAKAVISEVGAARTGMRISPFGVFNDMRPDEDMEELYGQLAARLSELKLAYVHVVDHSAMGAPPVPASIKQTIRNSFGGAYILSGGYDRARAEADLEEAKGDLVAFGRPFLANPDLVERIQNDIELSTPDESTFYTPGAEGYITYASAAQS
jgi:N-ethylmaleimide reductase